MDKIIISNLFKRLSEYETIRGREFPSRTFSRYSKIIKYMKSYNQIGDRICITTNYGDTILGSSSSFIFNEIVTTGICSRLIEYEKTYGVINQDKTTDVRISYYSAESIVNYINNRINELKKEKNIDFDSYVTGSFRRQKETIGDLDYIVVNFDESNRDDIIEMYHSLFDETLVQGRKKIAGIVKSIQVDIRFIEPKQLPCMLLHSTGSANHNIYLRRVAINKGYKLNEYCIKDSNGNEIYPKSEKEIFDILEVPYVDPADR